MTVSWPLFLAMCLAGYLSGSIPSGVMISKLAGVDDIMSLGSGNTGATNVFRVLGPKYAFPVLAIDILKGALPACFALNSLDMGKAGALAGGVCAILGHNWSVFLRFRGGKGVATTAGSYSGVSQTARCSLYCILGYSGRVQVRFTRKHAGSLGSFRLFAIP